LRICSPLNRLVIMWISRRENQMTLAVTEDQRSELSKCAASRILAAGDVFRARLILALVDGRTCSQIMSSLQTTAPTISRWKQRFQQDGVAGLDPRGTKPAARG
jgi:hypothetical protein